MRVFVILLFIIPFVQAAGQNNTFTLSEAIDYALDHSQNMESAELDIRDADLQIRELKAIGLPQIEGSTSYRYNFEIPAQPTEDFISPAVIGILNENNVTPEPITPGEPEVFLIPFGQPHNFDVGITGNMLLFDGSYLVALQGVREFKELVKRQKDQTIYETRTQVTKAYVNVLINVRGLNIIEKNIKNLTKTVEESEAIYKEGFIEKLDVDRLRLSLNNLNADKTSLERIIKLSKNLLKFQMNYPIDEGINLAEDIEELLLSISAEPIDTSGHQYVDRPEYRLLQQSESLNALDIKRNEKMRLPVVRAFGAFQRSLQDTDFLFGSNQWIPSSYLGVSINVPIYDGGARKTRVQRARLEVDKIKNQQRQFEQVMDMEVSNARLNLLNTQNTLQSRERALNLAEEIYEVAQIKYREGVGSSLEMTQAESSFYQSEQNYIRALYDVLSAHVDLHKSLGKL